MRRGEVFTFHFIPFYTILYDNGDGALLLTLIFKNLPGSKGHRMNLFPGIVIFVISGFYLLASVINEIENRHEHQRGDGASRWGRCLREGGSFHRPL